MGPHNLSCLVSIWGEICNPEAPGNPQVNEQHKEYADSTTYWGWRMYVKKLSSKALKGNSDPYIQCYGYPG